MKITDYLNVQNIPRPETASLYEQIKQLGKNERFMFLYSYPLSPTLRFVPKPELTAAERAEFAAFLTNLRSQCITREQSDQLAMALIKARNDNRDGATYVLDSMGSLQDSIIPKSEDDAPLASGYKLKPNATAMYQLFVDRNHKR